MEKIEMIPARTNSAILMSLKDQKMTTGNNQDKDRGGE